jgi:hypothetical protein
MVEERQKGGDALGGQQNGSDLKRQAHFLALPDHGA